MRRTLRVTGIVVVLLLLVVVSVPFLIDANRFRPMLESQLTQALGREVKVGALKLSLLSGGVSADDLSVADDAAFSHVPFVRANSLKLGVAMWPLIVSRKINVTGLTIDHPQIALIQNAAGDWNFATLGIKPAAQPAPASTPDSTAEGSLDLSIKLVKVTNGRLTLQKAVRNAKPLILDDVDAELRDFSPAVSFPYSLKGRVAGKGEVKLDGKVGPVNPTNTAMTPMSAVLKVSNVDVAHLGYIMLPPGMDAVISIDASSNSDGKLMTVSGRAKADHLKLARNGTPARRTVEFDFALDHDLLKHAGRLSRGDIHIGKANATFTGTYAERGEELLINMLLSGPKMPVTELAEMLPPLGVELPAGSSLTAGVGTAKIAIEGPTDRLVSTGTLGLSDARLSGFDLGSKMSTIEKLAGIKTSPNTEIQAFGSSFKAAPDGISANDIRLVVPSIGEISGAGTISPAQALDFKLSAMLHTGGVLVALSHSAIPFTVAGTASNPVFRPDVKGIVKQEGKAAAVGIIKGLLGNK